MLPSSDGLRGSTDYLREYLRSKFGSMDLADYIMEITLSNAESPMLTLPVHGLLIGRSPRLRTLMFTARADQESSNGPRPTLRDATTDNFVTSRALVEVLKYLYGGPLLDVRELTQGLQPLSAESIGQDGNGQCLDSMRQALAYAASGQFFGLEEVVSRGVGIAKTLLRWDTLHVAAAFALFGGLSPMWEAETAEANVRSSTPSFEPTRPTYGNYSTQLLQDITDFIAYHFPKDFQLDATAPQLCPARR